MRLLLFYKILFPPKFILLTLFCYLPISLLSQTIYNDVYTSFINLNQTDGLSNDIVNDIYQDVNGYIWIGTKEGLNRFDGNKFISFKHINNDSTSISDNFVTSITGDSNGNIWVGTANGLNKYNRQTGTFVRYKSNPVLPHTLRSNHVRRVLFQPDNMLWVETIDGTLSRLEIITGIFDHFSHKPISQPNYLYHTLWRDDNGDIFIGGRNLGIHILDIKKKEFRLIYADPNNSQKKRDNDLAAILKTSKGVYYVAGIDGFYSFDPISEIFIKLYKSSTFSLCELPDGRVLMGTCNGMVIYNADENTFIRYVNDAANTKSLINNYVNKVFVDKAGNIWAGTNEGFSILKKTESSINNYFYIPGNSKSLSGNRISSILQDSKNRIWIGTRDQGLNLWETTTNTFKHFKNDPNNPESISSNNITKIYEDRKGDIWIGLWSGVGFNKFSPEKNQFARYALNENSRKLDWYNDIMEDSQGIFWLGIWGSNGFQAFDRNSEKFLNHFNSRHIPANREIHNLLHDGIGNFFVKTDVPVIYIYNYETELFETHISSYKYLSDTVTYKHFVGDLPVNPDIIYAMETNNNGCTLFATDIGLMAFDAKKRSFSKIEINNIVPQYLLYSKKQQLFYTFSKNTIRTLNNSLEFISAYNVPGELWETGTFRMKFDSEGDIWVIAEKGIFKFSPKNETWEEIDFGDMGYSFEKTRITPIPEELLISSDSGLWRVGIKDIFSRTKIALPANSPFRSNINYLAELDNEKALIVSDNGIGLLQFSTNKIKYINVKSRPLTFSYKISGLASYKGKVFLSSNMNVFELDFEKEELNLLNKPDKYMVSSRLTTCMLEDSIGNVWIGTSSAGLNKLNTETGIFNHYTTENTNFIIPDNEINCLYSGSGNTVWVGTSSGLCSFNHNAGQFILHSKEWNSKRIESILSTSDSILWLGTKKGLIRYNTQSLEHQIFLESDGLPTSSFNKGAYLLNNGLVVMATNQGIITFEPDKLIKSNNFVKTEITGFNIFNEPFNLNIQSGDTIKLSYKNNFFAIDFSTMNFDSPNSIQYAYNMTGMGEKWISTTNHSVNFTNLASGKYLFTVCQQGFENFPYSHSHLAIIISPPFWKTFWFRAMGFILLSSIAIVLLTIYIRQIKIRERNALLEQKLLTSQMNPHFIFNSLSAIQSFIYKTEPETAGNYLSDFSCLIRLILENSRSELISLDKEIKTLTLYIGLQQLRFTNKFDYQVTIDPRINTKTTCIPPMLAQPFIENSIEHGIMHLKSKGNISIHFGINKNTITIDVVDNGIGLKQSKLINIKRETHTSFATSIAYERLANLTRGGNKNIGIIIADRSDTEGLNGTSVNIKVPFKTVVKMKQSSINNDS